MVLPPKEEIIINCVDLHFFRHANVLAHRYIDFSHFALIDRLVRYRDMLFSPDSFDHVFELCSRPDWPREHQQSSPAYHVALYSNLKPPCPQKPGPSRSAITTSKDSIDVQLYRRTEPPWTNTIQRKIPSPLTFLSRRTAYSSKLPDKRPLSSEEAKNRLHEPRQTNSFVKNPRRQTHTAYNNLVNKQP